MNCGDSSYRLPGLVDRIAETDPHAVWAEYPRSSATYSEGFNTISYQQLRNATHAVAHHLHENLDESKGFPTLAYIGPNDARYQMLLIGAIRARFKMFFTSPRNSTITQIQLLKQTGCTTLLVPGEVPLQAVELIDHHDIHKLEVPDLETLLNAEYRPFSHPKEHLESSEDEIFVLHTSGSTGVPKPLIYTNDYVSRSVAISQLSPPDGFASFNASLHGKRIVQLLPSFHIAGVYFNTINAIYNRSPIILPLPNAIPTAQSLVEILEQTPADAVFLSPVTLEELSKSNTALDAVASRIPLLFYSGAPLSASAGAILNSKTTVLPCYGSSEYGAWPLLQEPNAPKEPATDFQYIHLHPAIRAKFRHRVDDLFELVLPHHPRREHLLPPFLHYPGTHAFHTRDLFSPHPTARDRWRYRGRADDIVVFSTGEKTNPVEYEGLIAAHPPVRAALVVGAGRPEPGLLVEPKDDSMDADSLLEAIRPTVERANSVSPAQGRVPRDRILVVPPGRAFSRAGKGTVQRLPTLREFGADIQRLYEGGENGEVAGNGSGTLKRSAEDELDGVACGRSATKVRHSSHEVISELVRELCRPQEVDEGDDFFLSGMDSLLVLKLVRGMSQQLGYEISPKVVYGNPSIDSLTRAIDQDVN